MSTDELRICARRVLIAWDGTVLPKRRDETMFERMEDLRAALEAQPQPEPVAWIDNLGRPRYVAPPAPTTQEPVELTDGEIETLRARNIVRNKGALNSLAFARAVIAADRAKETKMNRMDANKLMALLGLEYPTTSRYKELHAVVTQALEDARVEGANQENSLWKKHMAETEQTQPEPVAWIDNLGRPQPHCVTDLKYCSVLQHELKEHLSYIPLYVSPPAPTTQEPEPDDYAALLRYAREILVKTGTVDVPYEQLGAGFLNVGIAPRLARDLRVRFHRDEVNARMVFGT